MRTLVIRDRRATGREFLGAPASPLAYPRPLSAAGGLARTPFPMKRAIIFLRPEHPTSYETTERKELEADGYDVRTRNARQFSGVPDPCELCVTDVEAIKTAYESEGTDVRGFKVKAEDAPAGKPEPTTAAGKARKLAAEAAAELAGDDTAAAADKGGKAAKK